MLTTGQLHEKLKEISKKYLSGNPPLNISSIAQATNTSEATIKTQIEELMNKDIVTSFGNAGLLFTLTEKGKSTEL